MAGLGLTTKSRYSGVLSSASIGARANTLVREARVAARASAAVAQAESLSRIQRTRPDAPARKGRDEPSIAAVLKWRPVRVGGSSIGVGLNLAELNTSVKHWIIQEIGTGDRAVVRVAGRANPVGRPSADASYIRTVKAQTGRRISSALVWGTGPGGEFVRAGAGENQQLYLRKMLKVPKGVGGAAYSSRMPGRSQPGIIIRKEIEPRHFVQKGGIEGFRVYRTSVLAAARREFGRPR